MNETINKALYSSGSGTAAEATRDIIREEIQYAHSSMVGIIKDFDADKQTATVQPAVKRIQITEDVKTITITDSSYPALVRVPVQFPGGGDWAITFPVSSGDECLLLFTDNSLDNWKKYGGEQEPSQWRRYHSMKDAIAVVGIRSPGQALSNFNTDDMEIRNTSGSTKFTIKDGEVSFNGDITVTGGDVVADGISLKGHNHTAGLYVDAEARPITGTSGDPI